MTLRTEYDLVIIGSGFGGSLMAMVARRLGLSVLLLERGRHPRFAIGESTSPLANLLLEELARRYDLPRLLPLTTYGEWQRIYPQIGCGLKRGFTFFGHQAGRPFQDTQERENQLLVAASPHDEVADTHWLRADVDAFLMREAAILGADYRDEVTLSPPKWHGDDTATVSGHRQGQSFHVRTRLVIDATGPGGFLSRALQLPAPGFTDYPATQTLYSHFTGVHRCECLPAFHTNETPPYPMDDAALHHVFDGGWMWVLRFNNGVTSAGFAVTDALAEEIRLGEGEAAWKRLMARFPTVGEQFADAVPTRPFTYAPRLSYRAGVVAGPGWALLPSAAAFVDPLFSTGIPLTLLGIQRLGRVLEEDRDGNGLNERLRLYGETTLAESDTVADLISACYACMGDFPAFSALSMFYFAAASFSEMARRLESPLTPRRFLAADHPQFGPAMRGRMQEARHGRPGTKEATCAFGRQVASDVACLNIAGLCRPEKHNWYGVDLEDVIRGAGKLRLRPQGVRETLRTAPWAQVPADTETAGQPAAAASSRRLASA